MDNAQYAELFVTESREHVSAINHSLLDLERGVGGDEPVGAIFRAVHTIKGMSATMGYTAVASLSHELETLLDRVRRGDRAIDDPLMEMLFQAADVLESAIETAVGGASTVDVTPIVERLRAQGQEADAPSSRPRRGATSSSAATAHGWTAPVPVGDGVLVRVRLAPETPLVGVRAFLVVQAAKALGTVSAISPSADAMERGEMEHDFALRLVTERDDTAVDRALRAAGDVVDVVIGEATLDAGAERAASGPATFVEVLATSTPADGSGVRQQRSVRIDLRRLDNLMNLIGELVITRGRLVQLSASIDDAALTETVTQASRLVADLQDEIMTSRMVPVWQVFDRFPRLVRDAAHSVHKEVDFVIEGKEVELDRSMLDEVGDPIVHLLRNAVDHGIEAPAVRASLGKPARGRLTLSALRDRSAVAIRVTDDGKGVDRARVLQRAHEQGLVEPSRTELSDEELFRIISRPGFSTADTVTDLSGRGVGIDAVYNRVRTLGGS
ncbi:MAG: chemotaxis protein CheA, partial [Gemmatimonadaceae bacterium]